MSDKEQICWTCQKATGGCRWSRSLTPISGWTAEPTTIKDMKSGVLKLMTSYKITACPEFKKDVVKVEEIPKRNIKMRYLQKEGWATHEQFVEARTAVLNLLKKYSCYDLERISFLRHSTFRDIVTDRVKKIKPNTYKEIMRISKGA